MAINCPLIVSDAFAQAESNDEDRKDDLFIAIYDVMQSFRVAQLADVLAYAEAVKQKGPTQ